MNKIKNILSLGLLSIMALLIGFSSINYVLADDVQNTNNPYDNIDYDSSNYDKDGAVIDTDFGSDDFDYEDKDANSYYTFANNSTDKVEPGSINVKANKDVEEVKPKKILYMKANKAYKVTNLKHKDAIQKSYVASGYIFVSQAASDGTSYLSRCTLSGTTATYKDEMILKNFGHNQTLEFYSHNNKTYILIGCKSNTNVNKKAKNQKDSKNYGHNLTIQVGRIQYKAGTTISNYTQINRMVRLDCADTSGKPFDTLTSDDQKLDDYIKTVINRMDASLSSNKKYLVLAVRSIHEHIQYSYYDFDIINNLLDKVEGKTPNYISCYNNSNIKNACKFSFVQKKGKRILPNGSCQGIDFTNAYSIYMASGNGTNRNYENKYYTNYIPKIAKMVKNNNGYDYALCIRITNTYTSKYNSKGQIIKNNTTLANYYMEIEGIQNTTDYLYFVLLPARVPQSTVKEVEDQNHPEKSTTQYIYSLSKQDIEEKVS